MYFLNSMHSKLKYLLIFIIFLTSARCTEVIRPRGVSLTKKMFYNPSKHFTCIDGSSIIPFKFVNDDYCDCADGSDEPGTSACTNGLFNCANVGYIEKDIFSSHVNDGVCDCCDGSDEWATNVNCPKNCVELGEAAREINRRMLETMKQGNEIREEYKNYASQKRSETTQRIEQLKEELKHVEIEKDHKLAIKQEFESLEKVALEKHNAKLEEEKNKIEQENILKAREDEKKNAVLAFKELDLNEDGSLTYIEIMKFPKFDQNEDGIVTEDEAKFFLNSKDSMDLDAFMNIGWILAKPFYLKDKENENSPPENAIPENTQFENSQSENIHNENNNFENENPNEISNEKHESKSEIETEFEKNDAEITSNQGDENEEFLDENEEDHKDDYGTKISEEEIEQPSSEYDEETKQLIEKTKDLRQQYQEIESKASSLNTNINDLENLLTHDYGTEDEFMVLKGQCFEFTDREYTYKLCPFDNASQRPKDGGSVTNLGRWGHWTGPENDKYNSFKLEGGSTCWNGPPRSVNVILSCGIENKIISATEPARCEYQFEFETPAKCIVKKAHHDHSEL